MKTTRRKNRAAAALGALGGRAGRGTAKRRGGPDYYRGLVARRKDRRSNMRHRHLNHREYTLAAIDDIIARGPMEAWLALRDAAQEPAIRDKILRVCAAHSADPTAQRHRFWQRHAKPPKPLPEWDRVLSAAAHLQRIFPDAEDWHVVKEACANAALAIFDGLPGSTDAGRSTDCA
jgi:hypothetical protein